MQYRLTQKTFESFAQLVLPDGWPRKALNKMVRGNLKTIKNPQLRQQLTPDYLPGYKRVVMSNQYYKAIQQPQVNLCREDIKHFDEAGIVTSDGKHHPLDVVILATGFDARAYIGPMQLVNENGVNINDVWQHSITA